MISVREHRALQASVLALKAMNRDLRNDINRSTKAMLDPVWKQQIATNATTSMERRVIAKGARVKGGNPPEAVAASSVKALKGGLVPSEQWQVFEFGGDREVVGTYEGTSPKGKHYPMTRHTQRQIAPRSKGAVAYKALAQVTPRVVSLWVQMVVAKTYEALGEKDWR